MEQKTTDGKEYYSGVITDLRGDIQIVIFKNDKKTDNQPDYDILLSEPKEKGKSWKTSCEFNPSSTVSANFPDHDPLFMRVHEIDFGQFSGFADFAVFRSRRPLLLLSYFDLHNCRTWV